LETLARAGTFLELVSNGVREVLDGVIDDVSSIYKMGGLSAGASRPRQASPRRWQCCKVGAFHQRDHLRVVGYEATLLSKGNLCDGFEERGATPGGGEMGDTGSGDASGNIGHWG
jgi:hypothetical protein